MSDPVRDFVARVRGVGWGATLLTLVGTVAVLALGHDFERDHWLAVAGGLLVIACVTRWALIFRAQAELDPVFALLERNATETVPLPGARSGDAEAALATVESLPIRAQQAQMVQAIVPILALPPLLWALGFDGWLAPGRLRGLAVGSLASGLASAALAFFWMKEWTAPTRVRVAGYLEPRPVSAGGRGTLSLRKRAVMTLSAPLLAGVLLLAHVGHDAMRAQAVEDASQWAMHAVEGLAAPGDPEMTLDARVSERLPPRRLWSWPIEIAILPSQGRAQLGGPTLSEAFLARLERLLGHGRSSGRIVPDPDEGREIGAFQRLDDGGILIAWLDRADLSTGSAALGWKLAGVGLIGILLLAALGVLACRDVETSLKAFAGALGRLAEGDLRPHPGLGTGDGFGELASQLEAVRNARRSALDDFAETADHVEDALSNMTVVIGEVASASQEQAGKLDGALRLMESLQLQAEGISKSVEEVTATLDESASAIVELGAAGEELSDTASVMTGRVDTVSDSLEQMVRSVKDVGATTERLAADSEETSSSMEEMASAMRAVDTSAAMTAKLSRDVVDKAELGQEKVVQTIAGMEAIRDATDTAEAVIRGLGARTKEIGGILDVIDDVADETNLLALNAAIIAAQAGEQGKAFSVVADEIKELADRVLASTKEIGGLIRAVQAESENAIGAIEAGSASVMSGVDLSAEAGRTLEEITEASRESGTRIAEIVSSVREQTRAASHVAALMERVRESTEQIGAAGTAQDRGNDVVYRSARTMRDVAQQVQRTTEEQARGFVRIRENVEGVRGAVEQITLSLHTQRGSCGQVAETIGGVAAGTRENEVAAGRIREAMQGLATQARKLREDVERYRV